MPRRSLAPSLLFGSRIGLQSTAPDGSWGPRYLALDDSTLNSGIQNFRLTKGFQRTQRAALCVPTDRPPSGSSPNSEIIPLPVCFPQTPKCSLVGDGHEIILAFGRVPLFPTLGECCIPQSQLLGGSMLQNPVGNIPRSGGLWILCAGDPPNGGESLSNDYSDVNRGISTECGVHRGECSTVLAVSMDAASIASAVAINARLRWQLLRPSRMPPNMLPPQLQRTTNSGDAAGEAIGRDLPRPSVWKDTSEVFWVEEEEGAPLQSGEELLLRNCGSGEFLCLQRMKYHSQVRTVLIQNPTFATLGDVTAMQSGQQALPYPAESTPLRLSPSNAHLIKAPASSCHCGWTWNSSGIRADPSWLLRLPGIITGPHITDTLIGGAEFWRGRKLESFKRDAGVANTISCLPWSPSPSFKELLRCARLKDGSSLRGNNGSDKDTLRAAANWTVDRLEMDWPTLSCAVKERILLEDLLHLLLGIDGVLIRIVHDCDIIAAGYNFSASFPPLPSLRPWIHPLLSAGSKWGGETQLCDVENSEDASLSQLLVPLAASGCHVRLLLYAIHIVYGRVEDVGEVGEALFGAVREVLAEIGLRIGAWESGVRRGRLSLHGIRAVLSPTTRALEVVAEVVKNCWGHRGGAILNAVEQTMQTIPCTDNCREICKFLFERALVPVNRMIQQWVSRGVVCDTYGEFFVRDRFAQRSSGQLCSGRLAVTPPLGDSNAYSYEWSDRFVLLTELVPEQLMPFAKDILQIGKYLQILDTCNQIIPEILSLFNGTKGVHPSMLPFLLPRARSVASAALTNLFFSPAASCPSGEDWGGGLVEILRGLKSLCLGGRGDVLTSFFEGCEQLNDLVQPGLYHTRKGLTQRHSGDVDRLKIEVGSNDPTQQYLHLFEAKMDSAIRYVGKFEWLADHLNLACHPIPSLCESVQLLQRARIDSSILSQFTPPQRLIEQHHQQQQLGDLFPIVTHADIVSMASPTEGFKQFVLAFSCPWPLRLFFTQYVQWHYHLVFRLLLQLHYCSRHLNLVWKDLIKTKEMFSFENSGANLQKTIAARHHMSFVISSILYYATTEVIEFEYEKFVSSVCSDLSFEEMLDHHTSCLQRIGSGLFFEDLTLLQSLTKTVTISLTFASHVLKFSNASTAPDPTASNSLSSATLLPSLATSLFDGDCEGRDNEEARPPIGSMARQRLRRVDERRRQLRCGVDAQGYRGMVETAHASFRKNLNEFIGHLQNFVQRNIDSKASYLLSRLDTTLDCYGWEPRTPRFLTSQAPTPRSTVGSIGSLRIEPVSLKSVNSRRDSSDRNTLQNHDAFVGRYLLEANKMHTDPPNNRGRVEPRSAGDACSVKDYDNRSTSYSAAFEPTISTRAPTPPAPSPFIMPPTPKKSFRSASIFPTPPAFISGVSCGMDAVGRLHSGSSSPPKSQEDTVRQRNNTNFDADTAAWTANTCEVGEGDNALSCRSQSHTRSDEYSDVGSKSDGYSDIVYSNGEGDGSDDSDRSYGYANDHKTRVYMSQRWDKSRNQSVVKEDGSDEHDLHADDGDNLEVKKSSDEWDDASECESN